MPSMTSTIRATIVPWRSLSFSTQDLASGIRASRYFRTSASVALTVRFMHLSKRAMMIDRNLAVAKMFAWVLA